LNAKITIIETDFPVKGNSKYGIFVFLEKNLFITCKKEKHRRIFAHAFEKRVKFFNMVW